MSGMFQRIARRHADRSDEPVASETDGQAASAPGEPRSDEHPVETADASAVSPPPAGEPPAPPAGAVPPSPGDDAPTQQIEAVAPAPAVDRPTVFQPIAPAESVPPPAFDLRARMAPEAAAPAQSAPAGATAPTTVVPAPVAAEPTAPVETQPRRPGYRARGRMRRRLRYLRRLRELQVRDLGGLVFDLRRFERKRDDLVAQKLDQIRACDDELHALELALGERRDLRDVREPGIGGTCPRCFAIHGSADRFCANCGAALGGAVQGPAVLPPPPPDASGAGPQR